ncbi:hypothetical protein PTKIN_Ptkin04bG0109500 [Pterospermum kingtungense]
MRIRKTESLFFLPNKGKVKYLDCKHKHMTKASGPNAYSSSSSSSSSTKCRDNLIEFACSACFFCVFCPLSMVWCCAKLPCKIGWRTVRYAINWVCCGSDKRVSAAAEYSSFSDLDLDDMPCKSPSCSSYPKTRIRHRPN